MLRTLLILSILFVNVKALESEEFRCQAKETLTAIEMNHGDILHFHLKSGEIRTMELLETDIHIILTNLEDTKKGRGGGGTIYEFTCDVKLDGQPMTFKRYVPVQESFYEPYVVNGLRIWFDGVKKIGEHFNENHGACVPRKDARFAMQDATLPISPQELKPWYPNPDNYIDVHESYNGDDVWMGTYFGADLHGGLDVNMPIGTPLWAPVDFDNQFYFNSIATGENNNRWRATKKWPNGDLWTLQAHHILELFVPQNTPIAQGKHYAAAAGELTGSHAHSHFVFKTGEEEEQILLDPWILFWHIFENNKQKTNAIRAHIAPCSPAQTGEKITFSSEGSHPSPYGYRLSYYWIFGGGGFSTQENPTYTFTKPGMYPVTLTVSDGAQTDAFTQHITVSGKAVTEPVLTLAAPTEFTFRKRTPETMDVYGHPPRFIPHTLQFTARPRSRPAPDAKTVTLKNTGTGNLSEAKIDIHYHESSGWLDIQKQGTGNEQELLITVNAKKMKPKHGEYHATISVDCPQAVNSPQQFRVQLTTPRYRPNDGCIVDNESEDCYATPYFWLSPQFHGNWTKGYNGGYVTNGSKSQSGEFIRFQPGLAAGKYTVSLHEDTPIRPAEVIAPDIAYFVRVNHKNGIEKVWMKPLEDRTIGEFEFSEGRDGYVDILAGESKGLIVVDAVVFRKMK